MSYNENLARYHSAASAAGLTYGEADAIRRDAERIDTWDTHECNGTIAVIEEGDGYPDQRGRMLQAGAYWVSNIDGPGPLRYTRRPDAYTPARARIDAIAAEHGLTVSHNGDPRGWPVRFTTPDGREFAPPIRPNK